MPSWRDFAGSKFQSAKNWGKRKLKGKIEDITPESYEDKDGNTTTSLYLKLNNHEKLIRLNVKNLERLGKKWGEDYEKWIGKFVTVETTPEKMEGKPCLGFLISPVGK